MYNVGEGGVIMIKEIWSGIKGFESSYKISNYGRVRSLDKIVISKNNSSRVIRGRVMKAFLEKAGYYRLRLFSNGKTRKDTIHKFVGEKFVSNPHNKPQINHKNGIKTDNRAVNLEWVTAKENMQHAFDIGLSSKKNQETPVAIIKNGIVIKKFKSQAVASRQTGATQQGISKCCNNNQKTAGGFRWGFC